MDAIGFPLIKPLLRVNLTSLASPEKDAGSIPAGLPKGDIQTMFWGLATGILLLLVGAPIYIALLGFIVVGLACRKG